MQEQKNAERALAKMQPNLNERLPELEDMVGESPPMIELKQIVERVSQYDFPVLIYGESGTGKELVARAIHQFSSRADKPFQALNCAALTDSLLESELFGYVGGAFTGARRQGSPSLFEIANHGSLFLDEVADLSSHAQAALLRVLEEHEVVRVGSRQPIGIDVRVITASNRPLEDLVDEGGFRHDLYHRLCVIPVHVPPLRKRRQDIPLLAGRFLEKLGDSRFPGPEIMEYLCTYHWPGNVRELEHCIDYMVAVTDGPFTLASLPPHIRAHVELDYGRVGGSGVAIPKTDKSHVVLSPSATDELPQDHLFILNAIDRANRSGIGIGRRALARQASEQGFRLHEGAIRTRLWALRMQGLVDWGRGRSGVRLTPKGQRLIRGLRTRLN